LAFLLNCPNCGERSVEEFRFGGELKVRPEPNSSRDTWTDYIYFRGNVAGDQSEWWYHSFGCRKWMVALRNTVTNEVKDVSFPEDVS
jgi:heterotetrameric sarcosine oxidase delta subunit